jgi:hypothetical protein
MTKNTLNGNFILNLSPTNTMKKSILALAAISIIGSEAAAQIKSSQLSGQINTVTTMVPFLGITPDSRMGGMGEAGVAAFDVDANSVFWNAANLVNAKKKLQFGLSYQPWLAKLVKDVGLSYLSGYYKLSDRSAVGGSLRYFSLGDINFTDIAGNPDGNFRPQEFAIDGCYALKFNKNLSMGVNLRYINSNLTGNRTSGNTATSPGQSVAGDISLLYRKEVKISGKDALWQFGTNIQNIGSKMTYTSRENRDFIPTNLKIGTALQYTIDDYQKVNFMFDINKLLVPTRPYYLKGANGRDSLGSDGTPVIIGKDPNVSPLQGMVQSFTDAPGGFKEELNEITYSFGAEYWYNEQFALRTGFFYEAATKGNRKYITTGIGIKYKTLQIDAAYLIPVVSQHPLAGQLRFSLLASFDSSGGDKK